METHAEMQNIRIAFLRSVIFDLSYSGLFGCSTGAKENITGAAKPRKPIKHIVLISAVRYLIAARYVIKTNISIDVQPRCVSA